MRFVFKQKAVQKICDMIAPKDNCTIVGFGDWRGPNGTPISRRCTGPLQEIKRKLRGRNNVWMLNIDEHCTSKRCCGCACDLVNMRSGDGCDKPNSKVHKVLHCQKSRNDEPNQARCGWTFDRDFNASKNILLLTMCIVGSEARPERFCRKQPSNVTKSRQKQPKKQRECDVHVSREHEEPKAKLLY